MKTKDKIVVDIALTYLVDQNKNTAKKADEIYKRFKSEMGAEFPEAKLLSTYIHQRLPKSE